MGLLRQVQGNPQHWAMTRQALANDGHCSVDATQEAVAALAFEQFYVNRLTTLVQEKDTSIGPCLVASPGRNPRNRVQGLQVGDGDRSRI